MSDRGVAIDGLALARVTRRHTVAVPARDGDRIVVAMVPTDAVERTPVDGIAPELAMSRLRAEAAPPTTVETLEPTAWTTRWSPVDARSPPSSLPPVA